MTGTTYRQLPTVSDAAGALSPLLVTDAERALMANPNLLFWWRARDGFTRGVNWRDRKTDKMLLPTYQDRTPTVAANADFNNKLVAEFLDTGGEQGQMLAASILPVNASFSVVSVGRKANGAVSNQLLWANSDASTQLRHTAEGYVRFQVGGSGVAGGQIITDIFLTQVMLAVCSYDDPGDTAGLRVNRGVKNTTAANANTIHNTDAGFKIGGGNDQFKKGQLAEIMVFDNALHLAANAALLAQVEGYLGTLYGIAAP